MKNKLLYIFFFILLFLIGLGVGRMLCPRDIITVEKKGEVITNSQTKYKYIKVKSEACQAYIDKYNELLALYKAYLTCPPTNVRTDKNKILFELWNIDVTNSYAIKYQAGVKQEWGISPQVSYSTSSGIGAGASIAYNNFCVGSTIHIDGSIYFAIGYNLIKF
jgi:hypothetical protein